MTAASFCHPFAASASSSRSSFRTQGQLNTANARACGDCAGTGNVPTDLLRQVEHRLAKPLGIRHESLGPVAEVGHEKRIERVLRITSPGRGVVCQNLSTISAC